MAETHPSTSPNSCAVPLEGLLAKISNRHHEGEDISGFLRDIIRAAVDYCRADRGCILLGATPHELACAASASSKEDLVDAPALSDSAAESVLRFGDAVLLSERSESDMNSIMCLPIKNGSKVCGVMCLEAAAKGLWDRSDVGIIGFVAQHASLAVENLRLRRECRQHARLVAAGQAVLNLSHSVKNILQMISGASEVVDFGLRTNQIHRVKRSWDILKPNLDRMKRYTLEMLDYSKERPLNPGPCDLNRVIHGAIESLRSQLKIKNARLNIRVDQRLPVLELDGERLHEMALNLILNAIDVVDSDTGLVSVETKYDAHRHTVSLLVSDNGPGIADEMKARIFTPFESDKKTFGTGLGMAIAKQIVDQHKGVIEVESTGVRGTTFIVTLPANAHAA